VRVNLRRPSWGLAAFIADERAASWNWSQRCWRADGRLNLVDPPACGVPRATVGAASYGVGVRHRGELMMAAEWWGQKRAHSWLLSAPGCELIVKDRQIDSLLSQVPGIIGGVNIVGKAMEVVDPHS
jgi:hypothetical protein